MSKQNKEICEKVDNFSLFGHNEEVVRITFGAIFMMVMDVKMLFHVLEKINRYEYPFDNKERHKPQYVTDLNNLSKGWMNALINLTVLELNEWLKERPEIGINFNERIVGIFKEDLKKHYEGRINGRVDSNTGEPLSDIDDLLMRFKNHFSFIDVDGSMVSIEHDLMKFIPWTAMMGFLGENDMQRIKDFDSKEKISCWGLQAFPHFEKYLERIGRDFESFETIINKLFSDAEDSFFTHIKNNNFSIDINPVLFY